MATSYPVFVLLSLLYIASQAAKSPIGTNSRDSNLIHSSCGATTNPALCIRTLSAFAPSIQPSTKQLAEIAISVTLDRAKSTLGFVSRVKSLRGLKKMEYQVISDCVFWLKQAVDRANDTVQEIKQIGEDRGKDFVSHISNMRSSLSAVVTDDTNCVDDFAALEGKIKDSVTAHLTNVTQAASNAFYLVTQLGSEK